MKHKMLSRGAFVSITVIPIISNEGVFMFKHIGLTCLHEMKPNTNKRAFSHVNQVMLKPVLS